MDPNRIARCKKRPARAAVSASMGSPVKTISIANDFPTALANLWVPPKPGIVASAISWTEQLLEQCGMDWLDNKWTRAIRQTGWPNFAWCPAMIMSHNIANSQPPPRAKPFTAAMMGFLMEANRSGRTNDVSLFWEDDGLWKQMQWWVPCILKMDYKQNNTCSELMKLIVHHRCDIKSRSKCFWIPSQNNTSNFRIVIMRMKTFIKFIQQFKWERVILNTKLLF